MEIMTTAPQFKSMQSWHHGYVPEGYALVPEGMDTTVFYQYNGCVNVTVKDNTITEITPNVEAWNAWKKSLPSVSESKSKGVRRQREQLLAACDWTQLGDCPLDEAVKEQWLRYRQALRDVPAQPGFPLAVVWPTQPE